MRISFIVVILLLVILPIGCKPNDEPIDQLSIEERARIASHQAALVRQEYAEARLASDLKKAPKAFEDIFDCTPDRVWANYRLPHAPYAYVEKDGMHFRYYYCGQEAGINPHLFILMYHPKYGAIKYSSRHDFKTLEGFGRVLEHLESEDDYCHPRDYCQPSWEELKEKEMRELK